MADAGDDEGLGSPQPSSPSEETQSAPGDERPSLPEETPGDGRPETTAAESETKSVAQETDSETKPGSESTAKAETDSETKPGSESTAKAEADSGSDAKTEPESETKPGLAAETKVNLLLKAAGDAPIMRQRLWKVDAAKRVTWVIKFISDYIKLAPEESLFVYVSQAFSPAPDQTIGNLLECFGSEGKLVLHYCKTQAWG